MHVDLNKSTGKEDDVEMLSSENGSINAWLIRGHLLFTNPFTRTESPCIAASVYRCRLLMTHRTCIYVFFTTGLTHSSHLAQWGSALKVRLDPTTTRPFRALVRATLVRLQSLRKPTEPEELSRTVLTMTSSASWPCFKKRNAHTEKTKD